MAEEKECEDYKSQDPCEKNGCTWDDKEKECYSGGGWLLLLPLALLLLLAAGGKKKSIGVPSHLSCVNGQCILVPGVGINQCVNNFQCFGEPPQTHFECLNGSCIEVPGQGINLCNNNIDCGKLTHKECVNDECEEIDGPGMDLCTKQGDCPKPPTHLACLNNVCTEVFGDGPAECNANLPCTSCELFLKIVAQNPKGFIFEITNFDDYYQAFDIAFQEIIELPHEGSYFWIAYDVQGFYISQNGVVTIECNQNPTLGIFLQGV